MGGKDFRRRLLAVIAMVPLLAQTFPAFAVTSSTSGNVVTDTYSYTNQLETWTVPAGVSEITISMYGGEGARGGNDSAGRPDPGGYKGYVSGVVPVSEGQVITIAVGGGATDSPQAPYCRAGYNAISGDPNESQAGLNPLTGYDGGNGGSAGPSGCSGYGGGGGAASVIQIGDGVTADSVATLVAAGSGGTGGSGQYWAVRGRIPLDYFIANVANPTSTNGEKGRYTKEQCIIDNWGSCDGGGGAGGGGGYIGGSKGIVEFGSGSSTEWFGYGGAPGQNWTANISTLSAGYEYYSANNGDGTVVISYSSGTPSAPTGLVASAGNASASIYWNAPTNSGLSAVTGYKVEYASGAGYSSWSVFSGCTSTATNCAITGLTNGTSYKFRVSAINSIGTGSASALSTAVTPDGPPAAPTIDSISPGDGSLAVSITPGSSTFTITDYEYSVDGGYSWYSTGQQSSPLTISGLLNGTVYAVELRAVSSAGTSVSSGATNATPSALPGAPTITAVTAGGDGTSLVVDFVAGFTGGSSITGYEYATSVGENTSSFGSYSATGTTSPFTITGLTSGTTYTVKLRAINAAGAGPGSAFKTGVTLAAPSAPVISTVTSGPQKLTVTYEAYTDVTNGGSPISKVEYSVDNGLNWNNSGTLANPFVISSLTNGQSYQIKLRATNAIGVSVSSTAVSGTPASSPEAPQNVRVSSGQGQATVRWEAPASNGGSSITGYTATAYSASTGGTVVQSCTTPDTSCTITGLSNGTSYYISLIATNSIGNSTESSPRVIALPAAVPGAPTINSITGGNAFLSVAFTAGSSDSNAPITGYQYSIDSGSTWKSASATSSPLLISGLSNGTTYQVAIRATSAVGNGTASSTASGKPVSSPDAVASGSITYTAASGSVSVSWTAPNDNGSTITNYEVSAFNDPSAGSKISSCTTSGTTSCTISGLSNGTTYYVSIQAQNSISYSPRSTPRVQVAPGNSTTVALTSSAGSVQVGDSVTLTATVSQSAATGYVNFLVGNSSITSCSSQTVTAGVATCVTTALPVGTPQIRANYLGDTTYSSSISSVLQVSVAALAQAVTFGSIADKPLSGGNFSLSATGGSSGNPVTFSSATTSVCTTGGVNGATVTLVAEGTCTINADQAGNANYGAATRVQQSFTVFARHTIGFDTNGGGTNPSNLVYDAGGAALTLPTTSKTSFVLQGWYTAASGGTLVGAAGASYTPTASRTLYAHWVQQSLWGMGSATKIGTQTTVNGVGTSFTATGTGSNVRIDYPADALPASTVIDVHLLADTSRAESLIGTTSKSFIVSLVVSWLASDGTVPDTADGKPLVMTITNSNIRSGAKIYSILGDTVTELGTATQDGVATVEIASDPEISIANIVTSGGGGGGGTSSPVTPIALTDSNAPDFNVSIPADKTGVVFEDGKQVSADITLNDSKSNVQVQSTNFTMSISSGSQSQSTSSNALVAGSNSQLTTQGSGFKASTTVSAFVQSQSQLTSAAFAAAADYVTLGDISVDSAGNFVGDLTNLNLAPGIYTLQVNGLTEGNGPRSVSIRLVIPASYKAWTHKVSTGLVKMYFKNPVGAGKVQFFVNGKEIAWVRAGTVADRKLSKNVNGYYIVRTVRLNTKVNNRLQIHVDGILVQSAVYRQ